MTELSRLIARLQKGITRNAPYIKTIRDPQLLVIALKELDALTGNDKVKDSVATQVSHLIMVKTRASQNSGIKKDEVMLNTVLYGPPGVGKTLIGNKLAKIWYSLGYLDGSRNSKDRKSEFGDLLKDLFKDSGSFNGSGTTDDSAITIWILFIFIIIFITLLSVAWGFYTRFGGFWTIIAIILIIIVIIAVGIYISNTVSSNNNNTSANKNKNSSSCSGSNCSKSSSDSKNNSSSGIHSKNNTNEYGNSPIMHDIPSDDEIIKVVTRADFVDKYVGWTDKKTVNLLKENLGKVLFVDEAYSLVTDMHDSFGMEALTALNLFLSQHSQEIIVIFAGYKDLMEVGLFSFQPGLKRRFMWQFDCNGYTQPQLFEIFKMQLEKKGWGLTDEISTKNLFLKYGNAFPAFGGDTERLTWFAELEHSRDYINNETGMTINLLTPDHIHRGILKLQENNIKTDPNEESNNPLANMMKLIRSSKHSNKNSNNSDTNSIYNNPNATVYSDRSDPGSNDLTILDAIRNSSTDRVFH